MAEDQSDEKGASPEEHLTVSRWRVQRRQWQRETATRLDALIALLGERGLEENQLVWLRLRWRAAIYSALSTAVPSARRGRLLQFVVVSGALAVPVLASFNAAVTNPNNTVRYLVLIVSLAVALATALQESFRFLDGYRLNWETAGALEAEGWAYFHGVSIPYRDLDPDARWATFVDRVETRIVNWNQRTIEEPTRSAESRDSKVSR
ncbi:MAG: DUF4231 domain-containing protein [Solirubrobacteraceae bacterium]